MFLLPDHVVYSGWVGMPDVVLEPVSTSSWTAESVPFTMTVLPFCVQAVVQMNINVIWNRFIELIVSSSQLVYFKPIL